jgi:hypothetical protein
MAARYCETVREFVGQRRPHDRVVPGNEAVAALGGDPLQPADRFDGFGRINTVL